MILKDKRYFALFIAPAVLLISIVVFYPLMLNLNNSFFQWDGFNPHKVWIGLDNYKTLISDFVIPMAIIHTLELYLMCLVFEIGLALILALIVDSIKAGSEFFRTVYFLPVIISGTAIGLMFFLMYAYDYGSLNSFLTLFGLDKVVWLNEKSAMLLVSIPVVWQYTGFYFVIFLTAFSTIPAEIYESAELEGISGIKMAIYITIPLVKNVIYTNIIILIGGVFKVFDIVYVITNGKPMNSSEILPTYLNQKAFADQNWGYGSAISILIFIIAMILWFVARKAVKDNELMY